MELGAPVTPLEKNRDGRRSKHMDSHDQLVTLYRAVGPGQMRCIEASGWTRFPARLNNQKFFFPQLSFEFAERIASDWNVKNSGAGYVVRFAVKKSFLEKYEIYSFGIDEYREYRIPASELEQFNDHIVGYVDVVAQYVEEWAEFAGTAA